MNRVALVTGSSGYLGAALVTALRARGDRAVGLDPVPAATTDVVGSVADPICVRRLFEQHDIGAVFAAGALHKPQVATHDRQHFIDTNVTGTQNLLEEAARARVDGFVFTSTTSLMITRALRARTDLEQAAWLDEGAAPLAPRNIYGVTKLAAEHLVRMMHELHGIPCVVLRTARFFPEEDDAAHTYPQSQPNAKLNELLYRRLTLDDAVQGHLLALERAPELGHDLFVLSAPTPFSPGDCPDLLADAPGVVRRLFPQVDDAYRRVGFAMFDHIDRVYDASAAVEKLGWRPTGTFAAKLDELIATGAPPVV